MRNLTDKRYELWPGSNAFSLSRWSRENEPKDPPRFKVGDTVRLTIEREITRVGEDCDGTVLYGLERMGFGFVDYDWELVEGRGEA